MDINVLKKAITLAEELGHIFVATSNNAGITHIGAAGKVILNDESLLEVTSWFCPETVKNIQTNNNVTLLVWDSRNDRGYQLFGISEKVEELHMLDGYVPEIEGKSPIPQIQRKLVIRLNKITEFKHAPHNDVEI
jgi:hypothetical protein